MSINQCECGSTDILKVEYYTGGDGRGTLSKRGEYNVQVEVEEVPESLKLFIALWDKYPSFYICTSCRRLQANPEYEDTEHGTMIDTFI